MPPMGRGQRAPLSRASLVNGLSAVVLLPAGGSGVATGSRGARDAVIEPPGARVPLPVTVGAVCGAPSRQESERSVTANTASTKSQLAVCSGMDGT